MGTAIGRKAFASAYEWELLGARDASNHGISITARPNQKLVMFERKSSVEREADAFLRKHGVRGLRVTTERPHDRTKGASVLSDEARRQIVMEYMRGETQTSLAARYGVSRRLIFIVLKESGRKR